MFQAVPMQRCPSRSAVQGVPVTHSVEGVEDRCGSILTFSWHSHNRSLSVVNWCFAEEREPIITWYNMYGIFLKTGGHIWHLCLHLARRARDFIHARWSKAGVLKVWDRILICPCPILQQAKVKQMVHGAFSWFSTHFKPKKRFSHGNEMQWILDDIGIRRY